MFLIRDSQLNLLEAAWQACADAVTPAEVRAAGDAYEAAIESSRAKEVKAFWAERAPHIKFRDDERSTRRTA